MKKTLCLFLSIMLMILAVNPVMAQSDSMVTVYAADGRTKEIKATDIEAYQKVGWYAEPVTKMYAIDGRTKYVVQSKVEANKAVGWYTEPVVKMYALDGRTKYVVQSKVEANKAVGWYLEPMVKMYAADGRTKFVAKTKVEEYKKVGWYTYPVYVADGSLKKPYIALNTTPVISYNYTGDRKIIFNVTGYARGDKAELIGGLKNAGADQEWILLKTKITFLEGNGEMEYLWLEDCLYNKSGSKYSIYDEETYFNYSWNKDGDIYNMGIRQCSTFAGGSMEGYIAVLTNKGAEMPIVRIAGKNSNKFVSTIGAPELRKKTKEEIIADNPVLSKCKLELPTVPVTLRNSKTTYDMGKSVDILQSKFNVTEITYNFEESSGGKVNLCIYYKGQKTYDVNGPGQTADCKIGWKLYDSEGYVVQDGTTYTRGIAMGEKFKEIEEKIYSLEPGAYKLTIMGVNGY